MEPISFCIILQRTDEMYGVIMTDKQDLLRTLSILEPHRTVSVLRLVDKAVLSCALLDQHDQLFPHLCQSLNI